MNLDHIVFPLLFSHWYSFLQPQILMSFSPVPILLDMVKTIHLLCVFTGVGGFITATIILMKNKGENVAAADVQASEQMALQITRYVEFYGLVLALITGFGLAFLSDTLGSPVGEASRGFLKAGYIHIKIVLVLVLIGLSHFSLRSLKRVVALRTEGKTAEADQLKQTHLSLGNFSLVLIIAIVFLVINQTI